jgi:hypothetical protein
MTLGNHIRAATNGGLRHGIDCGDRTVLFLGRDAAGRPEVRRVLLTEFAAGAERVETVVHREQVFAPGAAVARAFSRLRDPAAAASFGSSEAFVTWCLTGRPPEPGYAPAAALAARPPRPAARKKARPARRVARQAAPKRKAGRAAPKRAAGKARPAPRRKQVRAQRPARRGRRR